MLLGHKQTGGKRKRPPADVEEAFPEWDGPKEHDTSIFLEWDGVRITKLHAACYGAIWLLVIQGPSPANGATSASEGGGKGRERSLSGRGTGTQSQDRNDIAFKKKSAD